MSDCQYGSIRSITSLRLSVRGSSSPSPHTARHAPGSTRSSRRAAAGDVERTAPLHELRLAVLLEGVRLVEALQRTVVPLVEAPAALDRQPRAVGDVERDVRGLDGAGQHAREQDVRLQPRLLDQLAGARRLLLARLAEADIHPSGEEVLLVPVGLTVAQEDEGVGHGVQRIARAEPGSNHATTDSRAYAGTRRPARSANAVNRGQHLIRPPERSRLVLRLRLEDALINERAEWWIDVRRLHAKLERGGRGIDDRAPQDHVEQRPHVAVPPCGRPVVPPCPDLVQVADELPGVGDRPQGCLGERPDDRRYVPPRGTR